MGAMLGKFAVVLDTVARFGVAVVGALLVREFWGEPEPDSDGLPVRLLVPPLIAYLAWNIWVVTRSIRRWSSGALGDSSFLASLGVLSLVRLPWLLQLADDWWWHHRRRLMVLIALSIVTAVVALGTAIGLSRSRSPGVDVESRSSDRVDPIGPPRT